MPQKILIKRGLHANLPTLDVGELGLTTDRKQVYIGTSDGNKNLASQTVFDVKEYGATGDGVTDDSPYILNALEDIKKAGGGVLYFPQGIYIFGGVRIGDMTVANPPGNIPNITNLHNIVIRGAGRNISTIKLKNGTNTDLFVFRLVHRIRFEDISLDGNKSDQTGGNNSYWPDGACCLLVRDSTDVVVSNCGVYNSFYFGLNISSTTKNVILENNNVDNCGCGIDVAIQYGVLSNNYITNCSHSGIFLEGDDFAINPATDYEGVNAFIKVIANTVKTSGIGILVRSGAYCIDIEGNSASNAIEYAGIAIDSGDLTNGRKAKNIRVINNTSVHNTSGGFYFNNIEGLEVTGNISEGNEKGFHIYGVDNFTLQGNHLYNNKKEGIYIIFGRNGLIFANKIRNNNQLKSTGIKTTVGILIEEPSTTDISITNNMIFDDQTTPTQRYGIVLNHNPKRIFIENNNFYGHVDDDFSNWTGYATYSWYFNSSTQTVEQNIIKS